MKTDIEYLACPYSHPSSEIRAMRYEMVNKVAGKLISDGRIIFSPISHSHSIQVSSTDTDSWDKWSVQDFAFLDVSKRLLVLTLPGWNKSRGVKDEMARARRKRIPIGYLNVVGEEIPVGGKTLWRGRQHTIGG